MLIYETQILLQIASLSLSICPIAASFNYNILGQLH